MSNFEPATLDRILEAGLAISGDVSKLERNTAK